MQSVWWIRGIAKEILAFCHITEFVLYCFVQLFHFPCRGGTVEVVMLQGCRRAHGRWAFTNICQCVTHWSWNVIVCLQEKKCKHHSSDDLDFVDSMKKKKHIIALFFSCCGCYSPFWGVWGCVTIIWSYVTWSFSAWHHHSSSAEQHKKCQSPTPQTVSDSDNMQPTKVRLFIHVVNTFILLYVHTCVCVPKMVCLQEKQHQHIDSYDKKHKKKSTKVCLSLILAHTLLIDLFVSLHIRSFAHSTVF